MSMPWPVERLPQPGHTHSGSAVVTRSRCRGVGSWRGGGVVAPAPSTGRGTSSVGTHRHRLVWGGGRGGGVGGAAGGVGGAGGAAGRARLVAGGGRVSGAPPGRGRDPTALPAPPPADPGPGAAGGAGAGPGGGEGPCSGAWL